MSQQKKQQGGPPTQDKKAPQNPNLTVKVVSAYIYKDYEVKGKMDPYVKLKLGNQEYRSTTAMDQGQNPKWGEDFSFNHTNEENLIVELWEHDVDTDDDFLGKVEIPVKSLENKQGEQKYQTIDNGNKIADVTLNIKYEVKNDKPAKNQKQQDDSQLKASQNIQNNSQIDKNKQNNGKPNISVQIQSARIDKNYEEEKGKMDPYFIMKMGKQDFRTTTAKDQGQNPKWTEGAKGDFYRTTEDRILLELWEDDEETSDDYLGLAQVDINELISKQPSQNQYVIQDKNGQRVGDVQLLIQIDMNQMNQSNTKSANQSAVNNKNQNNANKLNIQPISSLGIQKLDASRTISKEELSQKTKEIQDRLNNIQVKLRPQPIVPYIEDNVHKALLEGMKKLAKERPTNPIRELGVFLINYNETSSSQRQQTN